jgi:hypothetical protein
MRGDTTEQVRQLANERGVSERTVWRWFASMYEADDTHMHLLEQPGDCRYCGTPLPEDATVRRRYCDGVCRQYARRARLEAAGRRAAARPSY